MKIWIASMECAGIAEAGGVKNVTFSLCKEFALLNNSLTLFIPVYKCTSYDLIQNLENKFLNLEIDLCNKKEKVSVYVNPSDVSKAIGQKGANRIALLRDGYEITVKGLPYLEKGEIHIDF